MSFSIVLTTINNPHPRFVEWLDYSNTIIVVADLKTPSEEWEFLAEKNSQVKYLSPDEQAKLFPELSEVIGWNTYARKNIGYAYSYSLGIKNIFETDDDTFPRSTLRSLLQEVNNGNAAHVKLQNNDLSPQNKWWNPYRKFSDNKDIWPRGFPLQQIILEPEWTYITETEACDGAYYQFLVNKEPDLDAIFRLTNKNIEFEFEESDLLVNTCKYPTPGNTQATLTKNITEYL